VKNRLSLASPPTLWPVLWESRANRITGIIKEQRAITVDTALRLARYFSTTPEFWMNLQIAYEIRKAEAETGEQIERTVQPRAA
jgi:plasmid maintenance system antidote protein VapI